MPIQRQKGGFVKKFLVAGFVIMFAATALAQSKNNDQSAAATQVQSKPTSTTTAKTETGTNKTADIRTLLTLTQAGEMAVQMMQEMLNSYRQRLPQVPDEFWVGFAKKIKTEDMVDMLVPIYDRHLTHSEVVALIGFFEGPVGKKLISVQPSIMRESMQVGQQWGEKIGNEVTAELQKKGYR
jgi:hypothetical protein